MEAYPARTKWRLNCHEVTLIALVSQAAPGKVMLTWHACVSQPFCVGSLLTQLFFLTSVDLRNLTFSPQPSCKNINCLKSFLKAVTMANVLSLLLPSDAPLKLASRRCRAFVPKRNSKTLPKLTSPDKLYLTFYIAISLSLCQGKQILSGYFWKMSLLSCIGAPSDKFEWPQQIDAISYPGCGPAR